MTNNIRAEIARAGTTQRDVARKIGKTEGTLCAWVSSPYRIKYGDLLSLADAIGCDVGALIGRAI